jgi:hypothetical protein
MVYILKSLSLQFENGKISNLSASAKYKEEIYKARFESWDDIESQYRPIYDKLHEEFKQAIHKGKQEFVQLSEEISKKEVSMVTKKLFIL